MKDQGRFRNSVVDGCGIVRRRSLGSEFVVNDGRGGGAGQFRAALWGRLLARLLLAGRGGPVRRRDRAERGALSLSGEARE